MEYIRVVGARLCVWLALTNILFIDDSSMAVHILLFGISHGFDITHDTLVMAWYFKDILRFLFKRFL